MALFNYATRELSAKIVYYGPGLSGKTTNIEMVHKMLRPEQKGRLISLPTETDRTLFFDFLPIELGQIKGFKVRFHLYTVPGQVFYNATRRLVLQGVDGVVFVADSQREMINGDMESLKNLMDNLSSYGKKLDELPFVLQYNKRDLRNTAPVAELDTALNFLHVPTFEAVASTGKGVTETLVGISRMVFAHLRKTLLMPGEMAAHDDIGDLADARIRKTFSTQAAEPLEEISDVEEIREEGEGAVAGVDLEPASLRSSEAPKSSGEFEELSEIEVEVPEKATKPSPPSLTVSADVEGSGLTFLKFEAPFVSSEGQAVLPALFIDAAGNPVRLRIRVTMDGE
ncbi:MAG: GTPase domain-containing protein [Candidatus Deferrimicrobium sp.]|nr:GTPase domain-containing protein [Candidatus Deferrimicrobium sp.]MDO8738810.1 GTPase domain-containing protein [Candidatus Deferrimicrobium sp.]